jgi:hypothetical protein
LRRTYGFSLGLGCGLGGQGFRLGFVFGSLQGKRFRPGECEAGEGRRLAVARRLLMVGSIEWTAVHRSLFVAGVHFDFGCLGGEDVGECG